MVIFGKKKKDLQIRTRLRERYFSFKQILDANNEVLEQMADMRHRLNFDEGLDMAYVRAACTSTAVGVFRIISNLGKITDSQEDILSQRFEEITRRISSCLDPKAETGGQPLALSLEEIDAGSEFLVGKKMASLADLVRISSARVPTGFVLTTEAHLLFVRRNGLEQTINKELLRLRESNERELDAISETIQNMILEKPAPEEIVRAAEPYLDRIEKQHGRNTRFALRSSASVEDRPGQSFAGQFSTFLNVVREDFYERYKQVLASKYSPHAILYRKKFGGVDENIRVAVGCMVMVSPRAAGIVFTQDPRGSRDRMVINAAPGLGAPVSDGSAIVDQFHVTRSQPLTIRKRFIPEKKTMCVEKQGGGVAVVEVPAGLQANPCLSDAQIFEIAGTALSIEQYYGTPQNIEWAYDHEGRLFILQSRGLQIAENREIPSEAVHEEKILVRGGHVACPGIATGKAFVAHDVAEASAIPSGAVLVIRQTSPAYSRALLKASALVSDIGAVTSHLALIAAEMGLPTIVGMREATTRIHPGDTITVDAVEGVIYSGEPPVRPPETVRPRPYSDTHVSRIARDVLKHIAGLTLTNPQSPAFNASACKTYHDITRYVHEVAIREMFKINDNVSARTGVVRRLEVGIPLSIFVIDLTERGEEAGKDKVKPTDITSVPFLSLLEGMCTEGIRWAGFVPIDMKGFFSVMANTLYDRYQGDRALGEASYAIISENYVNFSSRLAYHFATVDSYCGEDRHSNYITFRFMGGGASMDKKTRRAQFISKVLKAHEFLVEQKEDLVNATLRKRTSKVICEKLVVLGQLMGATRQIDVTMVSDALVDRYVQEFLRGNFTLGIKR
ncbi:hypothetical protein HZA56_15005 [Candidatus Poribacteria bacterium]|nr:hypothetical protein [Candidatus Poribacteria bacterium]